MLEQLVDRHTGRLELVQVLQREVLVGLASVGSLVAVEVALAAHQE
jgi:hypothetical protein